MKLKKIVLLCALFLLVTPSFAKDNIYDKGKKSLEFCRENSGFLGFAITLSSICGLELDESNNSFMDNAYKTNKQCIATYKEAPMVNATKKGIFEAKTSINVLGRNETCAEFLQGVPEAFK